MSEFHNITSEVTHAAFLAVGQLTVQWGLMEFNINALNSLLFSDFGGRNFEVELPYEFSRKTSFIRKCFGTIPTLNQLKDNVTPLLDKIANIADYRNDIIHGYMTRFEPNSNRLVFLSLQPDATKTAYVIKERAVTGMKLLELGTDVALIGHHLNQITVSLLVLAEGHVDLKSVLSKV